MAGWGIGGSVELQTLGPKSVYSGNGWPLIAPCHASAGQYTTLNCKPLPFRFPCKWCLVEYKCWEP